MKLKLTALLFIVLGVLCTRVSAEEFKGQFDTTLVAGVEDLEWVIFKFDSGERLSKAVGVSEGAHFAAAKLLDPRTEQYSLRSFLLEEEDKDPVLFVDVNDDGSYGPGERFALTENGRLWEATINLPVSEGFFKSCPIFVRYHERTTTEKMGPEDRLILQSSDVFARGKVPVKGKTVTVQYAIKLRSQQVTPQSGWVGVDIDEDGKIDMDGLSPEAAKANEETVVFRVGNLYISTKKADVAKNVITVRDHDAKDYKRGELYIDREFPEFGFTDFDGKKRKISEFRGSYVLLDIWGLWCGPCRRELPYLKEAHKRFQSRNLKIVGLNTDPDFTVESMKKSLDKLGMTWTQGEYGSVIEFLRTNLRINAFPTTFLLDPQGKIISMSREDRDEPSLRQGDLLKSLDSVLPRP